MEFIISHYFYHEEGSWSASNLATVITDNLFYIHPLGRVVHCSLIFDEKDCFQFGHMFFRPMSELMSEEEKIKMTELYYSDSPLFYTIIKEYVKNKQ